MCGSPGSAFSLQDWAPPVRFVLGSALCSAFTLCGIWGSGYQISYPCLKIFENCKCISFFPMELNFLKKRKNQRKKDYVGSWRHLFRFQCMVESKEERLRSNPICNKKQKKKKKTENIWGHPHRAADRNFQLVPIKLQINFRNKAWNGRDFH